MATALASKRKRDTISAQVTSVLATPQSQLYLSYQPTSSTKHGACNTHYLDRLGFKPVESSAEKRKEYMNDMKVHVQPPGHKFLNRAQNAAALKTITEEFLANYGAKYWGDGEQGHLMEPDILKGFLYPRDAQRPGSRLVAVLEMFFNFRATVARKKDAKKRKSKRGESLSGSEYGAELDEVVPDSLERMETRKRQRVLQDHHQPLGQQRRDSSTRRKNLSQDKKAFGSSKMPDLYGRTPPNTSTPEPIRYETRIEISDDDSSAGDEPQGMNSTKTSNGASRKKRNNSNAKTAPGFEHVKTEPLTYDMMKNTMFIVNIQDSLTGPEPVPFTECGNFNTLFPRLIEVQGVSAEDAKKINIITWTFTWPGGKFGGRRRRIKRDGLGAWIYFCDSLRKAHMSDADRFEGRCEVDIILHLDQ